MGNLGKTFALVIVVVLLSSLLTVPSVLVRATSPKTIIVPDNYPTIQTAIGNASNGDTIIVRNGTYQEQVLDINKSLSLIGENSDMTKIIIQTANPLQVNANQVTISGLTIMGDVASILVNGTDFQLSNNYLNAEVSVTGDGAQIVGNVFNGLSASLTVTGSYGVIAENTFTDVGLSCAGSFNRIFNNQITIYQAPHGMLSPINSNSGIALSALSNFIFNNTVTSGSINLDGNSSNNIIEKNNVFSIFLFESRNNMICGNYISFIQSYVDSNNVFYGNDIQGINLADQNVGTFYENNFMFVGGKTIKNVMVDLGVVNSLIFDNGSVGNYWSDYLSQCSNSTEIGNSGIRDTPYVIYLANGLVSIHKYLLSDQSNYTITITDRYPLMAPFDVSTVQIQLPSWANTTPPNMPAPLALLQNLSAQTNPTSTPKPTDALISALVIPIIAAFAFSLAVVVFLKFYRSHRN